MDDILLFSKDIESHERLLTKFYNLVKSQEIMLSEKKMVTGQTSIEFLGVNISNGKYTLQWKSLSSLDSLINDLKKKIKMVEQVLETIASMVKDMSISKCSNSV